MTKGPSESTATQRGFELGFLLGRHDLALTVADAARLFEMSSSGAYRLLHRAARSQRVRLSAVKGGESGTVWSVPREGE